jgi:hypothetical protein
MLLKLTLNEDWLTKQKGYTNQEENLLSMLTGNKKQLDSSNKEYGFSFLPSYFATYLQTALRSETPQPFNETNQEDRFEIENYGYAESEDELVAYLKNEYGEQNPGTFAVEVKLIQDYEKLYKHGTFIKNGVDTEYNYHYWFNEHGGEPECQYGKSEDGRNIFIHVTIWRKTK